jgi:hypothetical protein
VENNVKKNLDKFNGDVSLLNKYVDEQVETFSTVFEEAVKTLNDTASTTTGNPISMAHPPIDNFTL